MLNIKAFSSIIANPLDPINTKWKILLAPCSVYGCILLTHNWALDTLVSERGSVLSSNCNGGTDSD